MSYHRYPQINRNVINKSAQQSAMFLSLLPYKRYFHPPLFSSPNLYLTTQSSCTSSIPGMLNGSSSSLPNPPLPAPFEDPTAPPPQPLPPGAEEGEATEGDTTGAAAAAADDDAGGGAVAPPASTTPTPDPARCCDKPKVATDRLGKNVDPLPLPPPMPPPAMARLL